MKMPQKSPRIDTLEQALARITELEKALDEAIGLLVKRDNLLDGHERRIRDLEDQLDRKSAPPVPAPGGPGAPRAGISSNPA